MGNHDVYDTPEDRQKELEEKKFQKEVQKIHSRLLKMVSWNFTIEELCRLMNCPTKIHQHHVPQYTKDDFEWLKTLEKDVSNRKRPWA